MTGSLRLRRGCDLLIATHNRGKFNEFSQLLGAYGMRLFALSDFGSAVPVQEGGRDFCENALLKARAAARLAGMAALADDSGLCCAALGGAPGLYSARFGGTCSDALKNEKLWNLLHHKADKRAYFACAVACVLESGAETVYYAELHGQITAPRVANGGAGGAGGFGYDPIFRPDGNLCTFAELSLEEKNRISHRALALQKLLSACVDKV